MYNIVTSIIPIFLIALLGKALKTRWLTEETFWRGLEKLSYFILFPSVMFNYITKYNVSSDDTNAVIIVLVIATVIVSILLVAYKMYFQEKDTSDDDTLNTDDTQLSQQKLKKKYSIDEATFTSLFQGGVRYNSYIFFAIGNALYGKQGMEIIVVIAAYMIILTNILSISVFAVCTNQAAEKKSLSRNRVEHVQHIGDDSAYDDEEDDEREEKIDGIPYWRGHFKRWYVIASNVLLNPLILSSICGLLVKMYNIHIYDWFYAFVNNLSSAALSIGLLCVGASLQFMIDMTEMRTIGVACLTKLIVMPCLTIVLLRVFDVDGIYEQIGILYSALPTASNSYLLARQLGGNSKIMSSIITCTTLLSIVSLSIFAT